MLKVLKGVFCICLKGGRERPCLEVFGKSLLSNMDSRWNGCGSDLTRFSPSGKLIRIDECSSHGSSNSSSRDDDDRCSKCFDCCNSNSCLVNLRCMIVCAVQQRGERKYGLDPSSLK